MPMKLAGVDMDKLSLALTELMKNPAEPPYRFYVDSKWMLDLL